MHAIRIDIDGTSYRQHAGKDLAAKLGIGAVDHSSSDSDTAAASDD